VKQTNESEEAFKKRRGIAEGEEMKNAASLMASRLRSCNRLRVILAYKFVDEDHGSAAVTGLQMGNMKFLRHEV
jgi:hypothetical protein